MILSGALDHADHGQAAYSLVGGDQLVFAVAAELVSWHIPEP